MEVISAISCNNIYHRLELGMNKKKKKDMDSATSSKQFSK